MVDSVLLHILIKKMCTLLLIITMLVKKVEFSYYLAMNNNIKEHLPEHRM
jgi:hypothetical protein